MARAAGITVAKNIRHRHAVTAGGYGARTRSGQFAPPQRIARSHRTLTPTLSQRVQKHRRQVRTMAHGDTAAAFHAAKIRSSLSTTCSRWLCDPFALRSRDKSVRFGARLAYDTSSTGRALTILARAQCASPMRIDWFRSTIIKSMVTRVL